MLVLCSTASPSLTSSKSPTYPNEWQDMLLSEPKTKHNLSRLYIPPAQFSTEELDTCCERKAKGGSMQKTKTTAKRSFKNSHRRHHMKSIKFVVPSRKNMMKQNRKEMKINDSVSSMNISQLASILKQNKLINAKSNAPPSLMRNIAKSVF